MTTVEHHHTPVQGPAAVVTLGDMVALIQAGVAIPAARKPSLVWAVNKTIALLGHGASDLRADPKGVLHQLGQYSPAMAGLTPRAFSNLKALVRAAFRLCSAKLPPARSKIALKGAWAALHALLPRRDQRRLSRFLRFAQATGWAPEEVGDEQLEVFEAYLIDEVMVGKADEIVRATRRSWNRSVDAVPGWPQRRLSPPTLRRQPYWVSRDQLPQSLQQEMADYLHRLGNPDPFLGEGRVLSPETVTQYRHTLVMLASALARSGVPVEELTSIGALVRPHHVETALKFIHGRGGDRITPYLELVAHRVPKIASHVGLPEEDQARLRELRSMVNRAAPSRRGLAPKNRRLLDHLDDRAFVDRLITLPARIMAAARQMTHQPRAASLARDAVATELLLTCGMRVGNLVDLRVGETIRKFGEGAKARWAIEIPPEKVKNRQPLRYNLLPETVRLLEDYLGTWHPTWCGPSPWLFPARGGGHVDQRFLSESIAQRARRYVGVPITAHQFRHITAELYLREDPNGIAIVGQHLGHRDLNTTRLFYAREQSRIATQRYHEVLTRKRAQVPSTKPRRAKGA
jgi:integrase